MLNSDSPRPGDYWTLAAIVLLAALLRLVGLTRESFWIDELFSAYAAIQNNVNAVVEFVQTDVHPPGYFVALWAWAQVFGEGEYSLRSFSAIGGILLIPVVFRLGRQLFDVRTGLVSAFVSALLLQGVSYSQEVRAYIWLAFLSALMVTLAIDYVRSSSPWALAGMCVVSVANIYVHYFGTLFTVLLWGATIWRIGKLGGRVGLPVLAALGSLLAFVPWIPVALGSVGKSNWIQSPTPKSIAEVANIFYGPGWPLDLLCLAMIAAGMLLSRREKLPQARKTELWLLWWILAPLLSSLAVSVAIRPVYAPRNMLLAFAAASILLARSILYVAQFRHRAWPVAIAFMLVYYGLHFTTGKGYLVRTTKQQVRETSQFIVQYNVDQLPIVVTDKDRVHFYYYLRGTGNERLLQAAGASLRPDDMGEAIKFHRFWLASTANPAEPVENLVKDFEIERRGVFHDARAYLLRRKQ